MDTLYLQALTRIDQEKECGFSYLTSIENCYDKMHYHDFFELLLITEGKLINEVNRSVRILEKGSLVYFRPEDIHQLRQHEDHDCQFINLTFLSRTVRELWTYMGEDLDSSGFLRSEFPPCQDLSEGQLSEIVNMLNNLNTIPSTNKKLIRSTLRMLLMELYFKYLPLTRQHIESNIPEWFVRLCQDIKQKENFICGIDSLIRLSGKNHSYLCRTFKRYLRTTPTEHINQIRLNYAENLLLNSDLSITSICFDIGFGNLSHFYKLFEEHYKISPMKYRKKYWNSYHRW